MIQNPYTLTNEEQQRLRYIIKAIWAIPFIDDIEDFIWEAAFAYIKGIPLKEIDPLHNKRKKLLFDVTDPSRKIGWSLKALQHNTTLPCRLEVVIQRADIFKKAEDLGFSSLSRDTRPDILGQALLKHWYRKVEEDAKQQEVTDKRICILVKSHDRKQYIYYEDAIRVYQEKELKWEWTNERKVGLQAHKTTENGKSQVVFRWYPNQKQLFETFTITAEKSFAFTITPKRLEAGKVIKLLLAAIQDTP